MIPSGISRGPSGRNTGGFPLPLMIAAGVGAVVLIVFGWVVLTMGSAPATETVTADVPVKL